MVGILTGDFKWKIFKAARLLVSLSEHEVSPLAGYESLALGVPIIASDIDQWRELVEDGENGFIVDNKNIRKVAEKIIKTIESSATYERISQANREKYKNNYDSKIIARRRYELVYLPLLET